MRKEELKKIHESSICGQKRQMVEQIKEYGEYDFFSDYEKFLSGLAVPGFDLLNKSYINHRFQWYADCVISYHRIINR